MNDDLEQDLLKPKAVILSARLGYSALILMLATLATSVVLSPEREGLLAPFIGASLLLIAVGLLAWAQRGDAGARLFYAGYWVLVFAVWRPWQVEFTWGYAYSLLFPTLGCFSAALLFAKDSRVWYKAKGIEMDRAARAYEANMLAAEIPICGTCNRRLEQLDLGEGATAVIGSAPVLNLGVICTSCHAIQCAACKGTPPDSPCFSCGSPVVPAYQRNLM